MTNVTYRVLIRRNADGVERWYDTSAGAEYLDCQNSWWFEGNAACDCNRGQFFATAGGEYDEDISDEEDAERFPCGDERYTVLRLELPNGRWASDAEPYWHAP